MHRLLQRKSLVSQTVDILRTGLRGGSWPEHLPGELELCQQLQISRTTLRAALAVLTREGWLSSSQGRRRAVLKRAVRGQSSPPSRRVVLLTPEPPHRLGTFAMYWMDDLREHLAETGCHLEVHTSRVCFSARPEAALERLARDLRPAAWVLYLSTEPMQRWFSARALPCAVAGSRHAEMQVHSVDVDYQAIGQHAAAQFLSRHHRRLLVLAREGGFAGDLKTLEGAQAACARVDGASVRAALHDSTVAGITRVLAQEFRAPSPPTAVLVANSAFVLTALGWLARSGLAVPGEVSLIARDSEPFLDFVVPSVARYVLPPTRFARSLSRVVLALARGDVVRTLDQRLEPEFIPGETLGNLSWKQTSSRPLSSAAGGAL